MNNEGYYGMRRKRNIDLGRFRSEESSTNINSIKDDKLEEEWEFAEEIEEGEEEIEIEEQDSSAEWASHDNDYPEEEQLYLNGKVFHVKQQPKKQSFNETHVRITTYLEKNVHQIIRILQKQGQIESITKFINDSVKDYLMNHYQDDNQ